MKGPDCTPVTGPRPDWPDGFDYFLDIQWEWKNKSKRDLGKFRRHIQSTRTRPRARKQDSPTRPDTYGPNKQIQSPPNFNSESPTRAWAFYLLKREITLWHVTLSARRSETEICPKPPIKNRISVLHSTPSMTSANYHEIPSRLNVPGQFVSTRCHDRREHRKYG